MTITDAILAELRHRDDKPPSVRQPAPPAERLRRLGLELVTPCAGSVDGKAVVVQATLDRVAVITDDAGVRRVVALDLVHVAEPAVWRRPNLRANSIDVAAASERGRLHALEGRR